MAPFADNATVRWYLDYQFSGGQHTACFRSSDLGPDSPVPDMIRTLITHLRPKLASSWTSLRLRRSAVGSNLSFPVPFAPIVGGSAVDVTSMEQARFGSFTGRGATGRRVRITFFGLHINGEPDFRVDTAPDPEFTAAINYLRSGTPVFCTVDGTIPVWNDYMNTGYNAYFQRKFRRTR